MVGILCADANRNFFSTHDHRYSEEFSVFIRNRLDSISDGLCKARNLSLTSWIGKVSIRFIGEYRRLVDWKDSAKSIMKDQSFLSVSLCPVHKRVRFDLISGPGDFLNV